MSDSTVAGELGSPERLAALFRRDFGPTPPAAGPVQRATREKISRLVLESASELQARLLARRFGFRLDKMTTLYTGAGEGIFYWIDRIRERPQSPFARLDHCHHEFGLYCRHHPATRSLFELVAAVPMLMEMHRLTFGPTGGGWHS